MSVKEFFSNLFSSKNKKDDSPKTSEIKNPWTIPEKVIDHIHGNYRRKFRYGDEHNMEINRTLLLIHKCKNHNLDFYSIVSCEMDSSDKTRIVELLIETKFKKTSLFEFMFDNNVYLNYTQTIELLKWLSEGYNFDKISYIMEIWFHYKNQCEYNHHSQRNRAFADDFMMLVKFLEDYENMKFVMKHYHTYDLRQLIHFYRSTVPYVHELMDEKVGARLLRPYIKHYSEIKESAYDILRGCLYEDQKPHHNYYSFLCELHENKIKLPQNIDTKLLKEVCYMGQPNISNLKILSQNSRHWNQLNKLLEKVKDSYHQFDLPNSFNNIFEHRNFSKRFASFTKVLALYDFESDQLEQIVLGMDDDLDVSKYVHIDNTAELMNKVRLELQEKKKEQLVDG